ncbi:hypothetical protein GF343_04280 [Candidatus Woesearchaeota archaeon]|nr:hypothetical protein [Candidatus Woesearchaeota archaeon]
MKIISDLHIHSRYSRACSKQLNIANLEKYAKIKGLNLLGTGDFQQPDWQKELKTELIDDGSGIAKTKTGFPFVYSTEVSLIYTDGRGRRVHLAALAPNMETVEQITETLGKRGRLDYDGRPIFKIPCPEFVEMMQGISKDIEVIPAHCLLPDTKIHANPGTKEIKKISSGDKVLTHTGKWQKVIKTYKRQYIGEIHHIIPFYFREGLKTTSEHPFLAIKTFKKCRSTKGFCKKDCSQRFTCKRKYYLNYTPSWIQAKNLENSDILLYPRLQEIKDVKQIDLYKYVGSFEKQEKKIKPFGSRGKKVNPVITINKNFCRLVGYYLAEGYTNNKDAIGFCFNKQEKEYIEDVISLIKSVFGIKPSKNTTKKNNNSVEIIFYSKLLYDFFSAVFYSQTNKKAATKHLPAFFLTMPIEKQAEMLRGWWRGDAGTTVSSDLANQMKSICLRLGIIPSISIDSKEKVNSRNHRIKNRKIYAKQDHYIFSNLSFFEDKFELLKDPCFEKFKTKMKRKHGWIDEKYIYIPIKKIKKEKYRGEVFNLEVEKDNSYTTEFATVHNCWTPWFGLLGSMSGFDSLKEAFKDQAKHIHSIETGLSSDPPMNWRIKELENRQILSFSDAHSFWPWRIGREATLFDLKKLTYSDLLKAIRTGQGLKETIEFFPEEGKYHYDGHRNCKVCMSPKESIKHNKICPVCKKPMTIGVMSRVEQLADQPEGYKPGTAKPFKSLIPLSELVAHGVGAGIATQKAWKVYNELIKEFGNELNIVLEADEERIRKTAPEKISDLIIRNKKQKIEFQPGYDGEYGKPIFEGSKKEIKPVKPAQKGLGDFCK